MNVLGIAKRAVIFSLSSISYCKDSGVLHAKYKYIYFKY
jgi:hypothetical protein